MKNNNLKLIIMIFAFWLYIYLANIKNEKKQNEQTIPDTSMKEPDTKFVSSESIGGDTTINNIVEFAKTGKYSINSNNQSSLSNLENYMINTNVTTNGEPIIKDGQINTNLLKYGVDNNVSKNRFIINPVKAKGAV